MRVIKVFFICHLAALAFGLGGLLIVLQYHELWGNSPIGVNIFTFVLRYAGLLHILFGAATMLLFGLLFVGPGKTLIFFVASTLISLGADALGKGTGFPFKVYASNTVPNFKVAGLISYTVLLSWFYMGFTSYLLASKLISMFRLRRQTLWSLILGTYFLASWGLTLDLATASEHIPNQFGIWHGYGSYFGMPVSNLVGWILNILIFLWVSRLLWRTNFNTPHLAIWVPFGIYTANTGFVIGLNIGVGLWFPLLMSALLVLLPESLVLFPREEADTLPISPGRASLSQSVWLLMRAGSRVIARRKVYMHVEGLEHVPSSGPVLIAARHFHWFYDGYVLLRTIPRRLHTIVALDWMQQRLLRLVVEFACSLAGWPVVLRSEQFREHEVDERWAYAPVEARRYLRQVTQDVVRLLRSGEVLLMFPEGYPNIDNHPTPKPDLDAFLPFRPGFVKMTELAEKGGHTPVAIIPAGLAYTREQRERWDITVRFGPALFRSDFASAGQFLNAVEERVHELSSAVPPATDTAEETFPS